VAKLILWRADQLGALDDEDSTPMDERSWIKRAPLLDSLFSEKEPKTGTGGTMGWMADVLNPATGDDFVLGLKEITLPDGTHRPYSVWMSGDYPTSFDGLCKLLSLDMRVIDPAWVGMKLRKLTTYSEPLGEFMAKIPGHPEGKQTVWPSTVAYVAALVLHRYSQLGILDGEGRAITDMGLMAERTPKASVADHHAGEASTGGVQQTAGKKCPECHAPAMIKKDGCEFCTACGHVGSCG
jgi:ribonucleoside-diphosphate reductase alpha chain